MKRPYTRPIVLAALAIILAAAAVLIFSESAATGLAGVPAVSGDELTRLGDFELLDRLHTDISRRAGKDWRTLPECQRHLFVIGSMENGLLLGGGFLGVVLAERDAAMAKRPHLSDLAAAYRWLGLAEAETVVVGALRCADEERGLLDSWAGYDRSNPQSGSPPRNPFTIADQQFSPAVRASSVKRIAWVRAHVADVLAPAE